MIYNCNYIINPTFLGVFTLLWSRLRPRIRWPPAAAVWTSDDVARQRRRRCAVCRLPSSRPQLRHRRCRRGPPSFLFRTWRSATIRRKARRPPQEARRQQLPQWRHFWRNSGPSKSVLAHSNNFLIFEFSKQFLLLKILSGGNLFKNKTIVFFIQTPLENANTIIVKKPYLDLSCIEILYRRSRLGHWLTNSSLHLKLIYIYIIDNNSRG